MSKANPTRPRHREGNPTADEEARPSPDLEADPVAVTGEVPELWPEEGASELEKTHSQLEFEINRRERAEKERDRLLVAERQQRLLAETLIEVSTALNADLDHKEILHLILNQLARIVDYDSASVMLITEKALDVIVRPGSQSGVHQYTLTDIEGLPHVKEVLQQRNPVIIPDTAFDPGWKSLPGTEYIHSWLGVPLVSKDRVIGLLNLNKEEPGFYNQSDAELTISFANQAAVVLENAWLFEETRQRVRRLAALREIDMAITASLDLRVTLKVLLDQVIITLGVDAADVLLLNHVTQSLEYNARRGFRTGKLRQSNLRLGQGLAGRAALERRTIGYPDLEKVDDSLSPNLSLRGEGFLAYYAVPLIVKGQVKGVLEVFHRKPLDPSPDWLDFLETMADQAAIAIDNAMLFDDLQRSNTELTLAYDTTLQGWARALELRDKETEGHTQRVTELTMELARAMGMSENELVHVRRGAILHDIGKMGIPDSILLKPGALTQQEWEIMRRHPTYAYELLSPIPYLRPALDIPYCHHERWDGNGYPRGLRGQEIPLAARIFAVVDVWDALRSDRPYRSTIDDAKAREIIRQEAGKQLDPQVVSIFLSLEEVQNHR